MADDWDADDWDTKEITLPTAAKAETKPALPGMELDMKRFDDEDVPEPDAEPSTSAPKPPPKKKEVAKKPVGPDDTPLDDPEAEKARQQRLIEQADFAATTELFGSRLNLDEFLPKTAKDFDDLAYTLVQQYVIGHSGNKHYKSLVKALVKSACEPLTVPETKDIETSLASLRADKMKVEAAAAAAKKVGGKKANLNMGKQGPGPDLDDYDTYGAGAKGPAIDDDYDFM